MFANLILPVEDDSERHKQPFIEDGNDTYSRLMVIFKRWNYRYESKETLQQIIDFKNGVRIDRNHFEDGACNSFRNRFVTLDYLTKSQMVVNDFRILQTVVETILEVLSPQPRQQSHCPEVKKGRSIVVNVRAIAVSCQTQDKVLMRLLPVLQSLLPLSQQSQALKFATVASVTLDAGEAYAVCDERLIVLRGHPVIHSKTNLGCKK